MNIASQINLFLEQSCEGKASFTEELVQEFGERCKEILRKSFIEKEATERKFSLRMSNIGRPLRQLMLDRASGGKFKPSKEFKLKATVGHIYEAFMLALLKAAGVDIIDHDKQVKLEVLGEVIPGTYDVKIGGKIYDIKTCSPYSYEHKFASVDTLKNGDSFGYMAQGFGYGLADNSPFGGWIAINKATGEFKVLEIDEIDHDKLQAEYLNDIKYKVSYLASGDEMPACTGVEAEYFRTKPTGNKVLGRECQYCDHKFTTCHKNLQALPEQFSQAKNRKIKYYVGEVKSV